MNNSQQCAGTYCALVNVQTCLIKTWTSKFYPKYFNTDKKRSMTASNRHPAKKKCCLVFCAQDNKSKCISAAIEHSWWKRPKMSKVMERVRCGSPAQSFHQCHTFSSSVRKTVGARLLKKERLIFLKVGNQSTGRHLGEIHSLQTPTGLVAQCC